MMNKKGNASRIILWCLFFIIIGFLIYSLVLTYKEIKKKNPSTENVTTSMVDVAPRFAYNNEFEYSATSSITSSRMLFYSSSVFTDSHMTLRNPTSFIASGHDVYYAVDSPYYAAPIYTDNTLNIGANYNDFWFYADDNFNYYPSTNNRFQDYYQAVIMYDCNILVSDFVLTNYYIDNTPNANFALIYSTNIDNNFYVASVPYSSDSSINDFSLADHLDVHVANASYITHFAVLFWAKNNVNLVGIATFLQNMPNPPSIYTSNLTFKVFSRSNQYQLGYEDGFTAGQNQADSSLQNAYSDLVNSNNILNSQINSLNSRITQQQIIISQLQNEINTSSNNFKGLFFTMADIPFKTVSNALGFEFWGVNLFEFFVGVITALGIIWLIKKII